MTQPLDRTCNLPKLGDVDADAGEFWVDNIFSSPEQGHNLSAFESNRLFLNVDGSRFMDVSFASNADIDSDSRSVIATDLDGDRRPDLIVGSVGGGAIRVFRNDFPGDTHRVRINLVGETSNRSAIGSRVVATLSDGRKVFRDVFTPNGFRGQGPVELIIGTGESSAPIQTLVVRWPNGESQEFSDVAVDADVTITEGGALEVDDTGAKK